MIAFEVSRASSHPMIPAYPEINMSEKVYDCRNFFLLLVERYTM